MSNTLLYYWTSFSNEITALPQEEQPPASAYLNNIQEHILTWYRNFTDQPENELREQVSSIFNDTTTNRKNRPKGIHGAVHAAVGFLQSYLEPAEIVNMARFGAGKKECETLGRITGRLATFHSKEMESLVWLQDWLRKVDPLFPFEVFKNKLACCFSTVEKKYCFQVPQHCLYAPSLSWIPIPRFLSADSRIKADCCFGSTLSSCSGGTLSCDCVAGNTGCDCKAPNQFCSQNNKLVPVRNMLKIDPEGNNGCMLDQPAAFSESCWSWRIDLAGERLIATTNGQFMDQGQLIVKAKECQQTGFCPPNTSSCTGLC